MGDILKTCDSRRGILLQVKEDVTPYIVSRINLFNTETHDNT